MEFWGIIFYHVWVRKSTVLSFKSQFFLPLKNNVFTAFYFSPPEWVIRRNPPFKTQFFFHSKNGILKVHFFKSFFIFLRVLFVSGIFYNVSYKNSAAIASVDFPQENQTQQVRTYFRIDSKIALFLYIVVK